jgi:hypothetical protein
MTITHFFRDEDRLGLFIARVMPTAKILPTKSLGTTSILETSLN